MISVHGLPQPTPEILAYQDWEVGYFFHWDIEVADPSYTYFEKGIPLPDVTCWNPSLLDTDQWVQAAVAGGAKYALLTAKHCSGFCLWPTRLHDYHVGNTPSGVDVVKSFVESCRRFGIAAGIYYSLGSEFLIGDFLNEDGTEDRTRINHVLISQLEELLTWYGPIQELWFDGGVLRADLGGPDIPGLLERIAPDIICFGGPPGVRNVLRWSWNESGIAPPECYSTARFGLGGNPVNTTCDSVGGPDDPVWAPMEVAIPGRDLFRAFIEGWMYREGEEDTTYSGDYLFERYLTSVGRNANLLIGALPNASGLISKDQADAMSVFGNRLVSEFGSPVAESSEMLPNGTVVVEFGQLVDVAYVEIMEDQTEGQNILAWVLELPWPKRWSERWIPFEQGKSIGHKRIVRTGSIRTPAIRVRITEGRGQPVVRRVRVFGKVAYSKG